MGRRRGRKNFKEATNETANNIYTDVCLECWEQTSWSSQCIHAKQKNNVCVEVAGTVHTVRKKPSITVGKASGNQGKIFGGTFFLCKNYPYCKRDRCTFAHGKEELMAWNGEVPLMRTCAHAACYNEKAGTVALHKCLSVPPHTGERIILVKPSCAVSYELVRSLPTNSRKMLSSSRKYTFKHSEEECQHSRNCYFPHSSLEELVWNSLLYDDPNFRVDPQEKQSSMFVAPTKVSNPPDKATIDVVDRTARQSKSVIYINPEVAMDQKTAGSMVSTVVTATPVSSDDNSKPRSVTAVTKEDRMPRDGTGVNKIPSSIAIDVDKADQQSKTANYAAVTKTRAPSISSRDVSHYTSNTVDLSQSKYKSTWLKLLDDEEKARIAVLEKCNGMYTFMYNEKQDRFSILPIDTSNKIDVEIAQRYSSSLSILVDGLRFHGTQTTIWFHGHGANEQAGIAFDILEGGDNGRKICNTSKSGKVECRFNFNKNFFTWMREGLEKLPPDAQKKLFPKRALYFPPKHVQTGHKPLEIELDKDFQKPALNAILSCPPSAPFLLTGPFGTGKTQVIACAAYKVATASKGGGHVLICVHHHQTANSYIDAHFGRLCDGRTNKPQVFRVVTSALRIPIESDFKHLYRRPQELRKEKYCNTILVSTFTTAALIAKDSVFKLGDFAYIFLDESAQALEPEAIIPLQLAGVNTTVVLAGDHLQTGPEDEIVSPEPRQGGLRVSLLQRLHEMYYDSDFLKETCMKSLLTNYRCHEAILRLPSNLFYECSLLAKSKDSKPHPSAPYPLVFVCTSLGDALPPGKEASLVISHTEKYLETWPQCWGPGYVQDVCIMAQTHEQQKLLRRTISQPHSEKGRAVRDQVRVTYAIQGLEFRMVVLNACWPKCAASQSSSLLGNIASERAFNTVLTRAKSLFVAVGDPFCLLDKEEALVNSGKQTRYCWREFLQTCIHRRSIIFSDSPSAEARDKLLNMIFSQAPQPAVAKLSNVQDTILMKSKEDFRDRIVKALKDNEVRLYRGQWIVRSKQDIDSETNSSQKPQHGEPHVPNDKHYILQVQVWHKGEAVSLNPTSRYPVYRIVGLNHRRGALDGAVVTVVPTSHHPQRTTAGAAPPLGKVDRVIKQGPQLLLLCRVDPTNCNAMIPLDPKEPKFFNIPHIAKVLLSCNDQTKGQFVMCFDYNSLKKEDRPSLRDVVPFDDAKNMLFLVVFICWTHKHKYPLGAVIDVLPPGKTMFHGLRILKAQFDIVYEDDSHPGVGDLPGSDLRVDIPPDSTKVDYPHCYTIDDSNSTTLDDALSLKYVNPDRSRTEFEFAVHITSMSSCSDLKKLLIEAEKRGCTVYPRFKGKTQRYSMLSDSITTRMSLNPNQTRRCVSVIGKAVKRNNGVITIKDHVDVKETTIMSAVKLSYEGVEEVLAKCDYPSEGEQLLKLTDQVRDQVALYNTRQNSRLGLCLEDQLHLLKIISHSLQDERLAGPPQSEFSGCKLPGDFDRDDYKCPFSKTLVEQLMIWANQKVSEFLKEKVRTHAFLRRQCAPTNKVVMQKLATALCPFRSTSNPTLSTTKISVSFIDTVKKAESGYLAYCLLDCHYPELYSALTSFRKVQSRAEYCRMRDHDSIDNYRHFQLNCFYTHFTSPLRRCFDILVQSVLLAQLKGRPYTDLDQGRLAKIVDVCNRKTHNSIRLERGSYSLSHAVECFENPKCESTFIVSIDSTAVCLGFLNPEMKKIERECSRIPLHLLKYTAAKGSKEGHPLKVVWSFKVCSLKSDNFIPVSAPHMFWTEARTEERLDAHSVSVSSYELKLKNKSDFAEYFQKHSTARVQKDSVVSIDHIAWSELKKVFTASLGKDIDFGAVRKRLLDSGVDPSSDTKSKPFLIGNFHVIEYTKVMAVCEPLDVWIGASSKKNLLQPFIQLVEPLPGLQLCVEHSQYPSECFSDPTLKIKRSDYSNIHHYFTHWESALLSEAAYSACNTRDLLVFKGVELHFGTKDDQKKKRQVFMPSSSLIAEPHFLYHGSDKLIRFELTEAFVKQKWCYFQVKEGDLLCARYCKGNGQSACRAIFHLVVVSVDDVVPKVSQKAGAQGVTATSGVQVQSPATATDNLTLSDALTGKMVYAKFLGEENSMISPMVKQCIEKDEFVASCDLQLIPSPVPMRRMYRSLLKLKADHASSTATTLYGRILTSANRMRNEKSDIHTQSISGIVGTENEDGNIQGGDRVVRYLWGKNKLSTETLNKKQWQSLKQAMSSKFSLIHGPPGTGKSVTGAHLAYAFALYNALNRQAVCEMEDKKFYLRPVMYCGPSNKSVDRVLSMLHGLIKSGESDQLGRPLRILRLYGKAVERKDFPGPYRDGKLFKLQSSTDFICQEEYQEYALHYLIRRDPPQRLHSRADWHTSGQHRHCSEEQVDRRRKRSGLAERLREAEQRFRIMHSENKLPLSKDIIEYDKLVHAAELSVLTLASPYEEVEVQRGSGGSHTVHQRPAFDIVLCTCNEASSFRVRRSIRPYQCIIDEAGMATEPDCLSAMQISEHVVLIGDHKQLQPVVESRDARDRGYSTSLFERYCNLIDSQQPQPRIPYTLLSKQYRMHHELCKVASDVFYNGRLETNEQSVHMGYRHFMTKNNFLKKFWPNEKPMMFCHVEGEEDTGTSGDKTVALQSKANKKEAECVARLAKFIVEVNGAQPGDLAILTPYKGQKKEIQRLIGEGEHKPKVFTIHESQGDEYNLVILSLVRTLPSDDCDESVADMRWQRENLGFVTDSHQICVALTRARYGLVILGNANLLKMDKETWQPLLTNHYKLRKCYNANFDSLNLPNL